MVEESTSSPSSRKRGEPPAAETGGRPEGWGVPNAARVHGWPGAWVGLAVLTGWHLGFGPGSLLGCLPRLGAAVLLAGGVVLALSRTRRRVQPKAPRPPRRRPGIRPDEVIVLVVWLLSGALAGMQGAAERGRVSFATVPRVDDEDEAAGGPTSRGTDASSLLDLRNGEEILAVLRVDHVDATRDPPGWQGWIQAVGTQEGWARLPAPVASSGFWEGAERGGIVVAAKIGLPLAGSVAGRPASRCRLAIRQAYRCGPPPRPGWERVEGAAARLRARLGARARAAMGEEAGLLAAWTLLGPVAGVPAAWTLPFRETGTMHLLSISGFHLTLLGGIFWLLARIATRGRRWSRWVGLSVLVIYAAMVTAPAPVLRSLGVALIVACGPAWGRGARAWNALGWTAALIPILEPTMPAGVSFRLSFAAMAGVLSGGAAGERLSARLAAWLAARGGTIARFFVTGPSAVLLRGSVTALSASLGATLLTSPWSFHHFGVLYPLGVIANLAVIPAAAVVLAVQLAGLVAAAAGAGPGFPLVEGGRAVGEGLLFLVRALAEVTRGWTLSGGLDVVTTLAWTVLAGVCLLVAERALAARPPRVERERRADPAAGRERSAAKGVPARRGFRRRVFGRSMLVLAALAVPVVIGVVARAGRNDARRSHSLEVRFLDVGQGDAILVRAGKARWLIDCGIGSLHGRDRLVPQLLEAGVSRLERVWLTHGDSDHWGGLPDLLLAPIQVDTLILSGRAPYPAAMAQALLESGRRIVVERRFAPWSRELGRGCRVELLHPGRDAEPEGSNEWSLAFLYEVQADRGGAPRRLLLSGDLEQPREPALIRALGGRSVDVAQLAHHGSRTAGSPAWWNSTRPGLGVISVGASNAYGLPHRETLASGRRHGARILRTDRHGAIRVACGARGWTVDTRPR